MIRRRLRNSLLARSQAFRRRRMHAFVREFNPTRDMRILDVGGTDLNWRIIDQPARVLLLNTYVPDEGYDQGLLGDTYADGSSHAVTSNVEYVLGDGRSVLTPTASSTSVSRIRPSSISRGSRSRRGSRARLDALGGASGCKRLHGASHSSHIGSRRSFTGFHEGGNVALGETSPSTAG